ncbi:MAG: D-2-hydroxyacid dehydrogenase [Bacillota bacterium]
MNTKILIMSDFKEEQIQIIKEITPEAEIIAKNRKDITEKEIEQAEIIYGIPTKAQIKKAKNLKWLQLESAGADRFVDENMYQNQDVILTNSSGVYGLPIAEHVLGMILAFNKNLHKYSRQQTENKWEELPAGKDFYGSVTGVIGLGDIGNELARKAYTLGSKVLAVKNNPENKPEYIEKLWGQDGIDSLLKKSDFVVVALPLTNETREIIDKSRIKQMKRDAFLVNIGRGELIEQEALITALKEGWIAGAGLDVTTPEPLPEDNPLWNLDNVILTPHVSGLSPSNKYRKFDIFKDNLERYIKGENLNNVVDFEREY